VSPCSHPPRDGGEPAAQQRRELRRKLFVRGLFLLLTGVSLYLLAPSLLEVFTSWRDVRTLDPVWVAAALGFEAASSVAVWELQRVLLRTPSWFAVGTSQLAGNAFGPASCRAAWPPRERSSTGCSSRPACRDRPRPPG
jgi:hypothetical protein